MRDKERIECFFFDQFLEDVLGYLEIGEGRHNFNAQLASGALPPLLAGQLKPIFSGNVADKIDISSASPGTLKIDRAVHFSIGVAMFYLHGPANFVGQMAN